MPTWHNEGLGLGERWDAEAILTISLPQLRSAHRVITHLSARGRNLRVVPSHRQTLGVFRPRDVP